MNIRLNNFFNDVQNPTNEIVYPIRRVPTIPVGLASFTINCESTLFQWLDEFVKMYGDKGFIKVIREGKNSAFRIYNDNYVEAECKVSDSVRDFGGSLD